MFLSPGDVLINITAAGAVDREFVYIERLPGLSQSSSRPSQSSPRASPSSPRASQSLALPPEVPGPVPDGSTITVCDACAQNQAIWNSAPDPADPAFLVSGTAARTPPSTRAGVQDDGSYTNSLKLYFRQSDISHMYVYMYLHMYVFMYVYRYTYTNPWSYDKN